MGGTILAGALALPIAAMVETAARKVSQMLVCLRYRVRLQPMATIKLNHLADGLLLSFYSGHYGLCQEV